MSDSSDGARVTSSRFLDGVLPVPAPPPGSLHHQFLAAARQHRLVVQRCGSCQASQFPPEVVCKRCQSEDLTWVEIPHEGHVYSWVRVWHSGREAVAARVPYLGVVIDVGLPGVRFIGNLLGDPHREVEIDAPVVAVFDHLDEDLALVQWMPAEPK